ncbi:hypothetical protein Rhe02_13650 [Rhizocola hellebori]|uniref:Uncharacterized protein n=1 Tax=Rhizocola hellebori TaxID=1392758 RepID=A0A8J3VET5_9ACTN|nr:hypothetical protein [Rhizocola hellebori]GIH03298.1 hypothetical protein Rhe02_13650 [Rhizocola hellebori]
MIALQRWHRPLMLVSGFMAVLTVVSVTGLIVDDRVLLGVPIWLKPFKFAVSFGIYSVTLAWMLSLPHKGQRWTWWLGTVFAVMGGLMDVSIVFVQAARGTFSHFNSSTETFDNTISVMFGIGVQGIMLTNIAIAAILGFQHLRDRAVSRAIHAGLFLALAGMGVGVLMVFVTDGQLAVDATGREIELLGGHSMAVRDGGPGMPLTNWSTIGGDLRAPHFLGLHGLQAMLLAAMGVGLLARRYGALRDEGVRVSLVTVFGCGYTGLVLLATWQALRGQPVIHPDAITLAGLGTLIVAMVLGLWAVLAQGRRRLASQRV